MKQGHTIYLDDELYDKLKDEAKSQKRSISFIVTDRLEKSYNQTKSKEK